MTTATAPVGYTEESLLVAGGKVRLLRGGHGEPLVVVHHDIGNPESEVLDRHCAKVGRDPAMISRSVGLTLEPSERADVDAIKRAVSAYAAVGMDEIIVGDFTLGAGGQQLLDAMDRFISEVAPEFR